jgi:hypothetical protein
MKPARKPHWIAAISPSKRASRAAYNREARRVVEVARSARAWCPVALLLWGELRLVEEVHHARGKGSEPLRHDKRGWFLVCRMSHTWIENHKAKARELGWVCPVGKFGTPFKPGEPPMPGSVAEMEAKGKL